MRYPFYKPLAFKVLHSFNVVNLYILSMGILFSLPNISEG